MQIKSVIHNQQYSAMQANLTLNGQPSTDKQNSAINKNSNNGYFAYNQFEKEPIIYDLKSLRNQGQFNAVTPQNLLNRDVSQVERSISVNDDGFLLKQIELYGNVGIYQSIKVDQVTGERQWGSLENETDIDAFAQIKERLNVEQNNKMSYITPRRDWLELAGKLNDEELNDLVDIIFDISTSVFLESKESGEIKFTVSQLNTPSEEIELILSQFNTLGEKELSDTIVMMTHLSERAEIGKNFDERPERYGKVTDIDDVMAASPMYHYAEGDLLRDYSTLMFSSELSDDERSNVNEHLLKMDYAAAGGLINSTTQVEDDSKQQLFSLLSAHDTEELVEIFSYLGNLANKDTFISQYEIEDEKGIKNLATVLDPVDGVNQKLLVESILNVAEKSGLDTVKEFIIQTGEYTDKVQSHAWQKIAESAEESANSLTKEDINLLLNKTNEEVIAKHHQIMKSIFETERPGGNMLRSTALAESN